MRPTSRRQFLRQTGAALGAAAAAPWAFGQAGDGQAPNVLFIAIDDLNDWAGCLGGHPQARTPNIDRLANEGCLFSNAFTSSPACGPSRTSALTGLLPSTTGVYGQPIPFRAVLPHAVPLPDHFRANGYHAMQMGKMFHMYQWWSWDEHLGFGPPALPEDRPLHGVPGLPERVDWGPVEVEDNEMRDGRIADWAIERLQRDYDQPFFLAPGFMKPHTPFYAPPEYFDMFPLEDIVLPEVKPDDLEDIPEAGRNMRFAQMDALIREHGAYPEAVQGYLAATAYMDAQLGRVLDALDASPHADNTVVMLWSDHGFNLGEKHTFSKFNIWEEACRVPLVIKAPGVTTPGTVCTRPVSLIDLYPTLVELTGVREQAPLDGASLVPLLKDPDLAWEQPALTTMFRGNHSLRTERWRYIRYADGSEELYDMENDPMCWDNLAKDPQYDEVKAKLARWLPAKDAEAIPAVDRETYTEWQQEWREHMQWRREWDERLRGGGPVE